MFAVSFVVFQCREIGFNVQFLCGVEFLLSLISVCSALINLKTKAIKRKITFITIYFLELSLWFNKMCNKNEQLPRLIRLLPRLSNTLLGSMPLSIFYFSYTRLNSFVVLFQLLHSYKFHACSLNIKYIETTPVHNMYRFLFILIHPKAHCIIQTENGNKLAEALNKTKINRYVFKPTF